MEIKRTIEVFSATNRRFLVRRPESEQQVVCVSCGDAMLTPELLAKTFGISQRNIFKFVEAGVVHFTELADGGATLICIASFAEVSGRQIHDDSEITRVRE